MSDELGLADTNGILRQPWVRPERTSAGLGWDRQYLSVQRERPYRQSFDAAGTHLVVLHLDEPVTVRRGRGPAGRARQVPAGGLFIHPAGRDLTVELGGDLSTVHLYLADTALQDAAGADSPVEPAEELGTCDGLLEQVLRSMDDALRHWEPAARAYVDQLGGTAAAQLVRRHRSGRDAADDGPARGLGSGRAGALPVPGQRVHQDAGVAGPVGQRDVVPAGQGEQQVQPGGGTLDARRGQVLADGGHDGVAPGALAALHRAQVPVVAAAAEQLRQHQLGQRRAAEVAGVPGGHQVGVQVRRRHQPAQPHARRERLRGAAGVHHGVRGAGVQRGHRRPVVAVLGVVVVLDDQPAGLPRPGQQLAAAVRGQDDAGRELVGRGEQRGARGRGREVGHPHAVAVDRDGQQLDAPVRQGVPGAARAGVLHREHRLAPGAQHGGEQRQRLRHPGDDQDAVRVDVHPARPGQPGRQPGAQPRVAAGVAVAQVGGTGGGQHGPLGAQPRRAGERREVGHAGGEVDVDAGRGAQRQQRAVLRRRDLPRPGGDGGRCGPGGDDGAGAHPALDQALVGQPAPRLDDDAAGDPELGRQGPRGRQRGARGQPAVGDRGADLARQQPVSPRGGAARRCSWRKSVPCCPSPIGPSHQFPIGPRCRTAPRPGSHRGRHGSLPRTRAGPPVTGGGRAARGPAGGLRRGQRRGLRAAGARAAGHHPGAALRGGLRAAGGLRPLRRAAPGPAAGHRVAVAGRGRRHRPGAVQRGAGPRVRARRTGGAGRCRRQRARGPRGGGPAAGRAPSLRRRLRGRGAGDRRGGARAGARAHRRGGVGWALVVPFCEAAFTLLAVPVLGRHGAWGVSVHTTWLAAVAFAVWGLVWEGPPAVATLTARDLLAAGFLAVAVTAVAFVLWYSTVGRLGAGRAGLLTGIAPVAAAGTGVLLGGAAPSPAVWLGIAVVAAGLAAGLRAG